MKLTAEEINCLAVALANILVKGLNKKEILTLKCFFSQVISNIGTYLLD